MITALLALLLCGEPAPAWQAETDFRRCAMKALAGEFGELTDWQEEGYRRGLELGTTCDTRAWVTYYVHRPGAVDRRGRRCSLRTAASNLVPENSWVWAPCDGRIRQVRDCGSKRNDPRARRKGADVWVDLWYRWHSDCSWGSRVEGIAVILREAR